MTTILPSSNFERSAIHPLSNVTARDGYTPYFQPTTQKMVTHQDVGGGIYKRILSQEAAYKDPAMLPPAGLTSGSIHLSAYRGAPVTSAMTFQDEKRAHAYEKAHSAMLPLLAPLVSQTPIEDKQYARLPPNKTYFNVKQRGTNPIEPRYKLDSTHAPETTNFQATQKIVGGKLLSGDQLSATSRSIAARSSASQERPAGDSSPERRLHSSPMAKDTQGWVGRTGNNLDLSDIQGAQSSHWHNKAAFPSRPRPTMDVSDIVAPRSRRFERALNSLDIGDIPGARSITAEPRKFIPSPGRTALYCADITTPYARAGTLQASQSVFGKLYSETQPAYRFGRTVRHTALRKPINIGR